MQVFNSLNCLQLKSLEEPRYLLGEFFKHPLACLTLASFLTTNSGDVARRHIKVPPLRSDTSEAGVNESIQRLVLLKVLP